MTAGKRPRSARESRPDLPERMEIRLLTPSHPTGGEGRGEGVLGIPAEGDQNLPEHAIKIAHDVCIGEAKHLITAVFQSCGPRSVKSLTPSVSVAVELDDEPLGASREVCNIRRKHDLALEFDAEATGTKMIPKSTFRLGKVRPQDLRAGSRFGMPLQGAPSPRPLPLKGERVIGGRYAFISIQGNAAVNA
jgi:hypothetical protein